MLWGLPTPVVLRWDLAIPRAGQKTPRMFTIRLATSTDEPILWQALFEAAHMADEGHTAIQAAKDRSDLARYVVGWPLPGDLGVIAVDPASDQPVGAAWVRLLTGDQRGYGWVDDTLPELAIGLLPGYRSNGIGTALLTELIRLTQAVHPGISLSTRATNLPAVRLYERCGFVKVLGSEVVNWTGGISYNMRLDF